MSSYRAYVNLHYLWDQMDLSITQTDFANLQIQYRDSSHPNLFVELYLKFPNPDLALKFPNPDPA